jgi:hypothetical protein
MVNDVSKDIERKMPRGDWPGQQCPLIHDFLMTTEGRVLERAQSSDLAALLKSLDRVPELVNDSLELCSTMADPLFALVSMCDTIYIYWQKTYLPVTPLSPYDMGEEVDLPILAADGLQHFQQRLAHTLASHLRLFLEGLCQWHGPGCPSWPMAVGHIVNGQHGHCPHKELEWYLMPRGYGRLHACAACLLAGPQLSRMRHGSTALLGPAIIRLLRWPTLSLSSKCMNCWWHPSEAW